MEYIFSNRKTSNWFSAIFTYLLGGYALASEKMYHCFDCEKEFEEVKDVVIPTKEGSVEQ